MLLFIASCMKKEEYPPEPEIVLSGYMNLFDTGQYATHGVLAVNFQDGDGDIGLSGGDTLPPYNKEGDYYYNFVITYFEKQQGVWKEVELDPPFSARIPLLNPEYPGKAIKGVIWDTIPLNPSPVYDTIRLEVFIYDRALHKSNVISTPDIILRRY